MFKKYSTQIKQRIRGLRSQGWSLGEISLKTGIPENTLSGWVRDTQLTTSQTKRIKQKIIDSGVIDRPITAKLLKEKMGAGLH